MQYVKRVYLNLKSLRAIAVLGVIFYHSEILINDKLLLSGGFFDIFFVISINKSYKKKNKFSFLNFYERRVRNF